MARYMSMNPEARAALVKTAATMLTEHQAAEADLQNPKEPKKADLDAAIKKTKLTGVAPNKT